MGSGCSSNSSQKAEDEEPLATQDQPSKAKTKTSNDLPHHNPPKKKPPSSKAQETRSNDIKNPNNNNRNDMNNNNSTKSGNNKSQILSEISNNKAASVVSTDPSGEAKAKGLQNDQDLASPKPKSRPPTPFSRPVTARVAQRPKTTTIFERAKESAVGQVDANTVNVNGENNNRNRSASRLLSVSQRGDSLSLGGGANSAASDTESILSFRSARSFNMGDDGSVRRPSAKFGTAGEEDIEKLKEFLRQKGL